MAGEIISGQSNAINTLINSTNNPDSSGLPGSEISKNLFAVVDVSLSYMNYCNEQRAINPNHEQTLFDETSAAFNASANSYISGTLATYTGLGILAINPVTPLVGTAVVGSIFVGWVSGKAYDAYLKSDVNTIVDHFFEDQNPSASFTITIDDNSKSTLNYTPILGATLSNSQAQQKAIELLNNLSVGTILSQTPIPQKIVINSSSQAGSTSSTYTIQSGDTLSQIAQSLGTTTQKLITANPFLTTENRISADGKYVLIKAGEKLSVSTSDIANSVKLQDVTLKNANGTDAGNFSNFFLDQANKTLLTNTDIDSKWKVNNSLDSLANTKIEFDFNSLAQSVLGTGNKNWDWNKCDRQLSPKPRNQH